MLSAKTWALALATWFGVTFVLCVAWCAAAPDGWHARAFLEMALPGFVWLSVGSFALGLAESIALGAYSGALFAVLHNVFARDPARETRKAAHVGA